MKVRGKLINIQGINNLGKTLQVGLLKERANSLGYSCETIKYPVYDLEPTGPRITLATKKGNPEGLTAKDLQLLNGKNKHDYEVILLQLLEESDLVIAEMYRGTSVAFGIGEDLEKTFLESLEEDLIKEDLTILFDGERFMEAKEVGHRFEDSNDDRLSRIRQIHLDLAKERGWNVVNANQPIEVVTDELWGLIKKVLV